MLVTPVGGMPEAVATLVNQLVMRSPAAPDIADAMERVASGALERPSQEACRKHAVEHCDWMSVYRRVRAVFLEAAEAVE